MNKKITVTALLIVLTITSGYLYYRGQNNVIDNENINFDEDINGFNLEEDLEITRKVEAKENTRACCLGQDRKMQILSGLIPSEYNTVLSQYNRTLPITIKEDLKYQQYSLAYDYILITAKNYANVRKDPSIYAEVVATIDTLEKVSLLERVDGEPFGSSAVWYRVALENDTGVVNGYIHSSVGEPRGFEFEKMQTEIDNLLLLLGEGELTYISNYKNVNGDPPKKNDNPVDEFGYRYYHSAAAYEKADLNSSFRYIPDGILVRILSEDDTFYYINVPTFNDNYYVEKKYIDKNKTLKELKKVVVVDRSQQNEGVFELRNGELYLVSYSLATTGVKAEYSYETTLGFYNAIEKRDRFQYVKKGTYDIIGYAPYAVRFSGGAYIHGVPVMYEYEDGEQVDPGIQEYLHTIGTFPRSSMCVRNFTSHAQFVHSFIEIGQSAVIVIE